MDIERMKKVNMLIKELQKHGMAVSPEDALVKADALLKSEAFGGNDALKIEPHHPASMEQAAQSTMQQSPQGSFVQSISQPGNNIEDQLNSLRRANQFLTNELERVKQAVSENIESLRSRIRQLEDTVSSQAQMRQTAQQTQTEPQMQPRGMPSQQTAQEPHPRSGNIKPEDVAIDKFFNFSKK